MPSGKIRNPFSGTGSTSSGNISGGLPGITTSDTTTVQLLAQTAQDVVQHLANFNSGVAGLSAAQQQQANATQQNTLALEQNTRGRSGGAASTIANAASSLLGGAGLLSPLLSGIMSLFGGSSSSSNDVAPQPFSLPAPVALQTTISAPASSSAAQGPVSAALSAQTSPAMASGSPVIVHVNAIDSRSFLDHKDAIAQAVREAVLHSHSLNEVLNQL